MSLWGDNKIKELMNRVSELERRMSEIERLPERLASNIEFSTPPPPDKRTKEYREWKNANSSRS